ncbi:MAG: hypothetical protein HQL78_05575 [Magnetococcales bacterium]|nr:hypothetical protein [Magnetococcales bacterium]
MGDRFWKIVEILQQASESDPDFLDTNEGNRLFTELMTVIPIELRGMVRKKMEETFGKLPTPVWYNFDGQAVFTIEQVAKYAGEDIETVKETMEELREIVGGEFINITDVHLRH